MTEGSKQIVLILQDSVFAARVRSSGADGQTAEDFRFLSLLHPRHLQPARFALLRDSRLLELNRFRDKDPGSWFIGNSVQSSGDLFLATPIDPLFLLLPYLLENSARKSSDRRRRQQADDPITPVEYYFSPLEQLVTPEIHGFRLPEASKFFDHVQETAVESEVSEDVEMKIERPLGCVPEKELERICDVRPSHQGTLCRLNEAKLDRWLIGKVDRLQTTLLTHGLPGVRFSFAPQDSEEWKKDALVYSVGLVSEYLGEALQKRLLKLKGLTAEDLVPKKSMVSKWSTGDGGIVSADGDTSDSRGRADAADQKKKPAAKGKGRKKKELSAKGMKPLTSYFTIQKK